MNNTELYNAFKDIFEKYNIEDIQSTLETLETEEKEKLAKKDTLEGYLDELDEIIDDYENRSYFDIAAAYATIGLIRDYLHEKLPEGVTLDDVKVWHDTLLSTMKEIAENFVKDTRFAKEISKQFAGLGDKINDLFPNLNLKF